MDDSHIQSWLKFAQMRGINRHEQRLLLTCYGGASQVFANAPWGASNTKVKFPTDQKLAEQLGLIHQHGIVLIPWEDQSYPQQLAQLADAPLVLFAQGELGLLSRPQIAMVGSRSASPGGLKTAHDFALGLANSGITIASGLALGVDAACHEGALKGLGSTVAVVATGLDQVYPRRHASLAERIKAKGVLVTEYAPLTTPRRESFPQRNRIISGLSLGVLVVEAGTRSGSLITARLAGEQGREIFAIPGSIHLPTSRGCHQLIRQGAKLVETIADVLVEVKSAIQFQATQPDAQAQDQTQVGDKAEPDDTLDQQSQRSDDQQDFETELEAIAKAETIASLSKDENEILVLVDFAPTPLDRIVEQSQLPIDQISSILLQLELSGHLAPCAGGQYQRIQ